MNIQSAILVLATAASSSLAAAPTSLVGEWYRGQRFSAAVYAADMSGYRSAGGTETGERMVLHSNGTYEYASIKPGAHMGSTHTGYLVACRSYSATFEAGKYTVKGDKITFYPNDNIAMNVHDAPQSTGCKGMSWSKREPSATETATWTVKGRVLRFSQPEVDKNFFYEYLR
ncbi:hypothetical protein [Deinococcus yavapaiensis]|uniref:Uncharacterized protein n=1 Tax=Deinococcus yavapaiensis KR-236 TaxID=694435 RepID=A0A318SCI5_9DEIO|nr:hypothetical protein [Deinococcus yavapaiensis]PYE49400.1 hypothetical protein DES52_12436 [Deinococcus yavapaiensis KR-236]